MATGGFHGAEKRPGRGLCVQRYRMRYPLCGPTGVKSVVLLCCCFSDACCCYISKSTCTKYTSLTVHLRCVIRYTYVRFLKGMFDLIQAREL